jgi:hypothetical protein
MTILKNVSLPSLQSVGIVDLERNPQLTDGPSMPLLATLGGVVLLVLAALHS